MESLQLQLLHQTLTESQPPTPTPMLPPLLHRPLTEHLLLLPARTELLVEEPVTGPVSALTALQAASLGLVPVLHPKYTRPLLRPQPSSPQPLVTVVSLQPTEPLHSEATLRPNTMPPRMTWP